MKVHESVATVKEWPTERRRLRSERACPTSRLPTAGASGPNRPARLWQRRRCAGAAGPQPGEVKSPQEPGSISRWFGWRCARPPKTAAVEVAPATLTTDALGRRDRRRHRCCGRGHRRHRAGPRTHPRGAKGRQAGHHRQQRTPRQPRQRAVRRRRQRRSATCCSRPPSPAASR